MVVAHDPGFASPAAPRLEELEGTELGQARIGQGTLGPRDAGWPGVYKHISSLCASAPASWLVEAVLGGHNRNSRCMQTTQSSRGNGVADQSVEGAGDGWTLACKPIKDR